MFLAPVAVNADAPDFWRGSECDLSHRNRSMTPDFALLIGRAVFLVFCFALAAVAFTRWRRASERLTDLFFEQNTKLMQRLSSVEEQLGATQVQLAGVREQMAALTAGLEDSEQRRTPALAAAAAVPSYQIAVRLARSGATREELISSCGLSRQEAELVQRLHGPTRPAKLAVAS
jgi:hypothetical protein